MLKLLVGILKGAVIGGALGYGAYQLAIATGFSNGWLTFGLIGAFVGLFVGKPIWSWPRVALLSAYPQAPGTAVRRACCPACGGSGVV